MRIIYLANHGNSGSDDTEGHIAHSLQKLDHEVVLVHEDRDLEILNQAGDVLLFHKWYKPEILKKAPFFKVFWYFDKIDFNGSQRQRWMNNIIPLVDMGFVTDGTWLKEHPNSKIKVIRQGIGDRDMKLGTARPDKYKAQIAFLGTPYAGREEFVRKLKLRYGSRFECYNNVFNKDLYDLCATVPIIVSPQHPSNDGYWSSRVYMTLGSGGFLIHPACQELRRELKPKSDFIEYKSWGELERAIDYYLVHKSECDSIRAHGYKTVTTKFTYTDRCRKILQAIQRQRSIGKTA